MRQTVRLLSIDLRGIPQEARQALSPSRSELEAGKLAAQLQVLSAEYEKLAKDDQVTAALDQINQSSKVKLKLGPSPQMKAEMPRIVKMAEQARSSAIPCRSR